MDAQAPDADEDVACELKLRLLGPVRLQDTREHDLTPKTRKTRALLVLLACARAPIARARLVEILWGDRGEEQAKASLRQALYELRSVLGSGHLSADRVSVSLGPRRILSDLGQLQDLLGSGAGASVSKALAAAELPLFAGLDDLTPEFDDWLRDERLRTSMAIVAVARQVGETALEQGDPPTARAIADELDRFDPLDEQAAQLGVRADLASGDRTGASRRYARLAARLREELGIAPTDAFESLRGTAQPLSIPVDKSPAPTLMALGRRRVWAPWIIAAAAVLLLLTAVFSYRFLQSSTAQAEPMVAVLPFESPAQGDGYFAAGVSDEILNLLGHQRRIKVLGRTSAAQLAKPAESLETARKLGVTYLLDGNVRSGANHILVIARLTRVADGAQVWSERYDRGSGDIFAVQSEIAGAVATRLARSFAAPKPQETRPDVYDAYLAARQLSRQRRDATLQEAEHLLRGAIARDPDYAPANAELAQVIMLRTNHPTSYGPLPLQQARQEAERYARRAMSLDPNLGEAFAAFGFLSLSDQRSEPYYRKAVEIDPQRPEFHRWLASSLVEMKRFDEAAAEFKRAVAIDPLWGLNYEHLCALLRRLGRDREAERYEQQFLRLSSDEGARLQFQASMANARYDPASELAIERRIYALYPNERQSRFKLASTLALLGERREAAILMEDDRLASAVLAADWPRLSAAVRNLGASYWDYGAGYWTTDSLLIASGQSRAIVAAYDDAQPLIRRGAMDSDKLVGMTTALSLLQEGRQAEARILWARGQALDRQLPSVGWLKEEREFSAAIADAFSGKRDALLAALDRKSRHSPSDLASVPAMSLRYIPLFRPVTGDARFVVIDERMRNWINGQRDRVGLAPISHQAWISDPNTLLTKN